MRSPEQKLRSVLAIAVTLGVCVAVLAGAWSVVARYDLPDISPDTMAVLQDFFPDAEAFRGLYPEDPPFSVIGVYRDGDRTGAVLAGAGSGYGGPIRVLVAADMAGAIRGVRVVKQSETPGLGDRILDDAFLGQFVGLGIGDPVAVDEDIDNVSGATVSARGTAEAVRDALETGGARVGYTEGGAP